MLEGIDVTGRDTTPPGFLHGDELAAFSRRLGYEMTAERAGDVADYRATTEASIASLRSRTDIPGSVDPAHLIRTVQGFELPGSPPPSSGSAPAQVPDARIPLSSLPGAPETAASAVAHALSDLREAHADFNCTARFLADPSTERAARLDADLDPGADGPLAGIPFTVKDVIDVAGAPTTGGSNTRRHAAAAERSAFAIRRLEAAGAIPIAKDSTTEFAASGPETPLMGVCTNPWDTSRWAGGSSSGTAVAIATGAVAFGVGTDVGGSIRLPSAWCGITGLKPTAGRISRSGVIPMSWSAEAVGPMARDAATVAAVFQVMAGQDDEDPRTHAASAVTASIPESVAGMSVVVPTDPLFVDCDESITSGIREVTDVLHEEGVSRRETTIPDAQHAHDAGYQIIFPELAAVHRPLSISWDGYGPMTARRMSRGITSPVSDYLRALQFGTHLQSVLLGELDDADALLVPTVAGSAPTHPDALMTINGEQVPAFGHQARITMICNLTGFPGLSFPVGFDASGLPVSAMLIGRPQEEHRLLALAMAYQRSTTHHTQRPGRAL